MKPFRKAITLAAIGAISVFTFKAGEHLLSDVQFARAEAQVENAREVLKNTNDLSSAFKAINKAMEQSVVHLRVTKKIHVPVGLPQFEDDMTRRFFERRGIEPQMPEEEYNEQATGSGVIVDADDGQAFIVTNNHVVSESSKIEVTLNDGRVISECTVVGTDPKSDVAVVKIKADRIITAKWGDSDKLEKGDLILAFGSPFGYIGSMSHGIVSATNRQANVIQSSMAYENFIQVDAPINPGNSGGPLVNMSGEVVGINTAIATRTGTSAGIGFAIPSNQAKSVYEALKTHGKIVRGYLGVAIDDVTNPSEEFRAKLKSSGFTGKEGVWVEEVNVGTPAYNILKPADVITHVDGKSVKNRFELRNKIASIAPDTDVKLQIMRSGKQQEVTVKLGEQPDEDPRLAAANPDKPVASGQIGVALVTPTAKDLEDADLPADAKGALIKQVSPGSLAGRSGLRPGDLIKQIGETAITTAEEAKDMLKKADLAEGVTIQLQSKQGERVVFVRAKK